MSEDKPEVKVEEVKSEVETKPSKKKNIIFISEDDTFEVKIKYYTDGKKLIVQNVLCYRRHWYLLIAPNFCQ